MTGLIWAQSNTGVIGRDGGIPWHLPEDLAHFKRLTVGHTVVMGRGTWESLPARVRPLPGRDNVVVSRDPGYRADGARVVTDLAVALGEQPDRVWVIGGGQIYALALPHATRCEVTEVDLDLPPLPGDTPAPTLDDSWRAEPGEWQTSSAGLRYRFVGYRRAWRD